MAGRRSREQEQGIPRLQPPKARSTVRPPPAMPQAPQGTQGQAGTGTEKHAAGNTPAQSQVSVEAASKFQTLTKSNQKQSVLLMSCLLE